MAEQTSFMFYFSWKRQLNKLNDAEFRNAVENLINYHTGEEIKFISDKVEMFYESTLIPLEVNQTKWLNKAAANQENGKKGGRPRKPTETQETHMVLEKPKKPTESRKELNVNSEILNDNSQLSNVENELLDINCEKPNVESQLSDVNMEIASVIAQEMMQKRNEIFYKIFDDEIMAPFKKNPGGRSDLFGYVESNNEKMICQIIREKEVPQHIVALIEQYHEYKM